MRRIVPARTAWPEVKEEGGGGEGICPKPRGHVGMEKKGTHTLIEGAKDALGTAILLGGVWTHETKHGAVGGKKMADGEIVKFFPVVGLKR